MTNQVTYGKLTQLLLDLGFEDRSGDHLVFVHPRAEQALVQLASHGTDEEVVDRDLVKVRAILDFAGVMERGDFEEWRRSQMPQKSALG